MIISKLTPADFHSILELQKIAYHSEAVLNNDFAIPALHETLEELKARYATHLILKYECDTKLVGSVCGQAQGGVGYITRLMVHPDHQGRKIGSSLLIEIERLFSHCQEYRLFTGLKSERNIAMYQRRGYKITHIADKLTYMTKRIEI